MKAFLVSLIILLLPGVALPQVAVRTQCPKHGWIGLAGQNCPYCVAEARRLTTTTPAPAPGVPPAVQATTDVLQKGVSTVLDRLLNPPTQPAPDPEVLRREAEQARLAAEQKQGRIMRELKLSNVATAPAPPVARPGAYATATDGANPLGFKLGPPEKSAELLEQRFVDPDPGATSPFGTGGVSPAQADLGDTAAVGGVNGTNNSPSHQLKAAAVSIDNAMRVFEGRSAVGAGPIELKTLEGIAIIDPVEIKLINTNAIPPQVRASREFQQLMAMRNNAIKTLIKDQSLLETLNKKQPATDADADSIAAESNRLENDLGYNIKIVRKANDRIPKEFPDPAVAREFPVAPPPEASPAPVTRDLSVPGLD